MQEVDFKDISEFLEFLPAEEKVIVEALRAALLEWIPEVKEKLSYNVPFYTCRKRICFIWPASVKWGGVKSNGVRLGFTSGYMLNDDIQFLDKENRKQVYWKDFFTLEEINFDLVKSYVMDAVQLDRKNI